MVGRADAASTSGSIWLRYRRRCRWDQGSRRRRRGPAHAVVELDPLAARTVVWALREFERRRRVIGLPVPPAVTAIVDRLILETHEGAADTRHSAPAADVVELIDTATAARILDVSPRHVRRLAADLDGQRLAGRWHFNRAIVDDYAQQRQH